MLVFKEKNNMSNFFSVVIPVYNCEKYVRQCILSVLEQKYDNFEVIIIDNGSRDQSVNEIKDILDDKRIKFIVFEENRGISAARNEGIRYSQGDYIIFLDSDDFYVDSCFFERLNNLIENKATDLVLFNSCKYFDDKNVFVKNKILNHISINNLSLEDSIKFIVENFELSPACWDKALKRQFIIDNKLSFVNGIRGEDVEWYNRVLSKVSTLMHLNGTVHAHRVRTDSTSVRGWDENCWYDIYNFIADMYSSFTGSRNDVVDKNLLKYRFDFYAKWWYILLAMSTRFEESKKMRCLLKKIEGYKKIRISKGNKQRGFLVDIVGNKIGAWLMYHYINRK